MTIVIFLQSSFKPVETLQELELLTSEVLLPLMGHSVVQGLINNLRYTVIHTGPAFLLQTPSHVVKFKLF